MSETSSKTKNRKRIKGLMKNGDQSFNTSQKDMNSLRDDLQNPCIQPGVSESSY